MYDLCGFYKLQDSRRDDVLLAADDVDQSSTCTKGERHSSSLWGRSGNLNKGSDGALEEHNSDRSNYICRR